MYVTFATTTFAPVVLGFFGLGTGYLIYGPQELFGFPRRGPVCGPCDWDLGYLAARLLPIYYRRLFIRGLDLAWFLEGTRPLHGSAGVFGLRHPLVRLGMEPLPRQ